MEFLTAKSELLVYVLESFFFMVVLFSLVLIIKSSNTLWNLL